MKKRIISGKLIVLLLIMCLAMPCVSVYGASKSKNKVTIKKANAPVAIWEGSKFNIKGTIKSSKKKIKRVEIGITTEGGGQWTWLKYDKKKLGCKSFDVKKARKKVKFEQLPAGSYVYRIYVHTADKKVHCVMNQSFTVVAKAAATQPTANTQTQPATNTQNNTATQSSNGDQPTVNMANAEKVDLSGVNTPGTYRVGTTFNTKGTLSCENMITRIEAGIVVAATNKWSEYKYDAPVYANSFDLRRLDSTLKFSMLPGGDYYYRIYIHTNKGVTIALNKKFTVTPSHIPQAAINTATLIANDSRFTYGKGYGGYFTCPICAGKFGKKEAQYTCMPFLAAAYAHASGFKDLMGNGKHVMNLHDGNFKGTLGNYWFKVGLCRDLTINDLQPGDCIVKYAADNSSGHVWMYGGGDVIIEAVPSGIRVLNTGAATKLRKYGFTEGKTSKNYVMRFRK